MTVSQTVQAKLEEAFGNDYWKQTLSKIHDDEPDIIRYDAFYKHELSDGESLELTVQYQINDIGKEHFEVIMSKHGTSTQIGESKMFTGKYAFKHAKEYIYKLN